MNPEKPKVLIVDDRPENLLALKAVLDSPNYNIVECTSGPQALREIYDNDYALIIMDVQMPEMDGFETATLIRSRDKNKNVPIIFLSAVYVDEESTVRGYNAGAVDYLVKPFCPEHLKKKVEFFADFVPQIKNDQHQKDICELYQNFKNVFVKMIDPIWYVLLNIQMMKRLSTSDRQKVLNILSKNMDNMEHAAHEITHLLNQYKYKLEENVSDEQRLSAPSL